MSQRSSFTTGDIKGVLQLLQDMIVSELQLGNNVELEGIGTFTASLQCPPVMDKKEIRAESIRFRTVRYFRKNMGMTPKEFRGRNGGGL